uniref:Protein kinase domain-containing protein n=1 Tax=Erythrolobus australicus TaxID=1077150 RepID=A0A7S1TK47_9RHOD
MGQIYNPGEGISLENWDAAFRYLSSEKLLSVEFPVDERQLNDVSAWCRMSDTCALAENDPVSEAPPNLNASESDPHEFMYSAQVDTSAALVQAFAREQGEDAFTYQILCVTEFGADATTTTRGVMYAAATFYLDYRNARLKDVAVYVQFTQRVLVVGGNVGLSTIMFSADDIREAFAETAQGVDDEIDYSNVSGVTAELYLELKAFTYVKLCANLTIEQRGKGPSIFLAKSQTGESRIPPFSSSMYARKIFRDETGFRTLDASELADRGSEVAAKEAAVKCYGPARATGAGDGENEGGDGDDEAGDGYAETSQTGLGAGAIVGIVVGALAVLALLAISGYYGVVRRKKRAETPLSDAKANAMAAAAESRDKDRLEKNRIFGSADTDGSKCAAVGRELRPDLHVGGTRSLRVARDDHCTQPNPILDVEFAKILIPKSSVRQLNLIGAGGFASVYRGQYGGADVAVKVLPRTTKDLVGKEAADTFYQTQTLPTTASLLPTSAGAVNSEAIPEDVKREIMSLEKCRHPAVAGFYGVCLGVDEHDPVWLVMELAKRGTLQDVLHSTTLQQFPWQERIKIAHHIALGMEYLHTAPRNIAHLDLKPDNIILNEAGMPRVIDFGIAGFYSTEGESSGLRARRRGTLMYMAPELLSIEGNEELREPEKADVYSFGMLCFVLAHQCGGDGAPLGRTVDAEGLESEDAGADGFAAYLSRLDDVLFRLTATARCDPRLYLDMVLAFRAEYGYQMRCAAACPISLREVITRCTRHDPNLRPCFSELIELLSAPH